MAVGITAGGQAHLQPVTHRHQFIDLGNDVVLFGKRWEADAHCQQHGLVQILLRSVFNGPFAGLPISFDKHIRERPRW